MRKNSLILLFGAMILIVSMVTGCGQADDTDNQGTGLRRQVETVKPNEDDGAIYRTTEEYVKALVEDDRNTVLSLLTVDHRNSWRNDSFLINADAKEIFDEITLANLNYTVVSYINNEETSFEDVGVIYAVYDVVLKKDGQEAGRQTFQDNLVFRKEDGQWRISVNERIIAGK